MSHGMYRLPKKKANLECEQSDVTDAPDIFGAYIVQPSPRVHTTPTGAASGVGEAIP